MPDLGVPSHDVPDPRRTTPASTCLALPSHDTPRRARARLASPAVPRPASPHLAVPDLTVPALPCSSPDRTGRPVSALCNYAALSSFGNVFATVSATANRAANSLSSWYFLRHPWNSRQARCRTRSRVFFWLIACAVPR